MNSDIIADLIVYNFPDTPIFVGIFMVALTVFLNGSTTEAQVELNLENNLQISHFANEPHPAILNSALYNATAYSSQIFGEVVNNFTYPISSVEIYAELKNSSGQTFLTANGYTTDFYLKPGQRSGFWILVHKALPQNTSYNLTSTHEKPKTPKPEHLKLDVKLMSLNPVKVVGTVTNTGTEKANNVGVSGIFYDKDHIVVYSGEAFVNIYTGLGPAETGSFILGTMIEYDQIEKIRSVALNVESSEFTMVSNNSSNIDAK